MVRVAIDIVGCVIDRLAVVPDAVLSFSEERYRKRRRRRFFESRQRVDPSEKHDERGDWRPNPSGSSLYR